MSLIATELYVFAALCVYSGALHALIVMRGQPDQRYVLFSLQCFSISAYFIANAGWYQAGDPATSLNYAQAGYSTIICTMLLQFWFIYFYTQKSFSVRICQASSALFGFLFLASLFRGPWTISLSGAYEKHLEIFGWFQRDVIDFHPGPVFQVFLIATNLGMIFLSFAVFRYYYRVVGSLFKPMPIAYALMLLAVTNDILFALNLIQSILMTEIAFMFVVLAMASSFLESFLDARAEVLTLNQTLEDRVARRTREIQRQNERLQFQAEQLSLSHQKIQQLGEYKDRILGSIAHELRGPVGNIQNMIHLILKKDLDTDDIRDYLILSRNSIEVTYSFLENLLSWALSQQGLHNPRPEPVPIGTLVQDNYQLLQYQATNKTIELSTTIDADLAVLADRGMLHLILRNIISNAVKFTGNGGRIRATASRVDESIQITITDSGIGMDPDNIRNVFSKSPLVSRPGTAGESGSGIGLMLVIDFIEKNQGTLQIESEPGTGTSFIVRLPASEVA